MGQLKKTTPQMTVDVHAERTPIQGELLPSIEAEKLAAIIPSRPELRPDSEIFRSAASAELGLNLSTDGQRIFAAASAAHSSLSIGSRKATTWIRLTTRELQMVFSAVGNDTISFWNGTDELRRVEIQAKDPLSGNEVRFNLAYKAARYRGEFYLILDPTILEHIYTPDMLKDLASPFFKARLGDYGSFNNPAQFQLYNFLKARAYQHRRKHQSKLILAGPDFLELRRIMGMKPDKYKRPSELFRWVIKPLVDRIREQTSLPVTVEPYKSGRRLLGVVFEYHFAAELESLTDDQVRIKGDLEELGVNAKIALDFVKRKPLEMIENYIEAYGLIKREKKVTAGLLVNGIDKEEPWPELASAIGARQDSRGPASKRRQLLEAFKQCSLEDQDAFFDDFNQWINDHCNHTETVMSWAHDGRNAVLGDRYGNINANVRNAFIDRLNNSPYSPVPRKYKYDNLGEG